jgi:hypothetical protein
MEPPNRNPSFDITETHTYTTRSPSPAPTYRSTPHFHQNYPSIDEKTRQALEEKHTPFHPPQAEPFDTPHPHYAASTYAHYPVNLPDRPNLKGRSRFPKLSILIPWILFTIFFLATLWYTSIALGIRLFDALHPSSAAANTYPEVPVVNVFIKGQDDLAPPSLVLSIATAIPPSKTQAPVPENGVNVNLGTGTVTRRVVERRAESTGFVVVTTKRC